MTTTPSIHTLPSLFRHHEPFPLQVHLGSTSSSHLQDLSVLFICKTITKGSSQSEIGQISANVEIAANAALQMQGYYLDRLSPLFIE